VLTKRRFAPDKGGSAVKTRYQWFNGSKTKEKVTSYVGLAEAVSGTTTLRMRLLAHAMAGSRSFKYKYHRQC
jgi:hypothetical protein